MKISARIVSLMLSFLLLFSLSPLLAAPVQASNSGYCGDRLYWSYSETDKRLTVSGSGTMTDWSSPNEVPWKEFREEMQYVSLPDGLFNVGSYAFYGCTALKSTLIPYYYYGGYGTTRVGDYAFYGCTSMTGMFLSRYVTSIGAYAYYGCTGLKSAQIPLEVTVGDHAFDNCPGIELKPGKIHACGSCGKNLRYTISVDGVLRIFGQGDMDDYYNEESDGDPGDTWISCPWYYEYSPSITTLRVESGVTSLGAWSLQYCDKLTSVELADTVTRIGSSAFYHCTALQYISVPGSVTKLGFGAFNGCTALTDVSLAEGLTELSDRVFYECTALKQITLPASLEKIGLEAFSRCTALETFRVAQGSQTYAAGPDGLLLSKDKTVLVWVPGSVQGAFRVPDGITVIGDSAFARNTAITAVTLPKGVQEFRRYAFAYCTGLTDLTLPDSMVTVGPYAFSGCKKLARVDLGSGVQTLDLGCFYGCSALPEISLPESVSTVGFYAFNGCTVLKSVTVLNADCVIDRSLYTLGDKKRTVITGYPNSTAHVYANSNGYSFQPLTQIPAPTVKAGNDAATGKVKLSWEMDSAWDSCRVYRAEHAEGPWTLAATVKEGAWTDTKTKGGETRYYYVAAACGSVTANSAVVKRTCDLPRPTVTASNVSATGKVKLTWRAVTGATGYQIYRADSKTGTYKAMKTTTATSYINTSATPGKTYWYKVVAQGKSSASDSARSEAVSRLCRLAKPVVTASNDAATGKVKLTWKAVTGAVGYRIYRATSKTGTYKVMKTTTAVSYINTTSKAGKKYWYKVVALGKDSAANSVASAVKTRICDLARPTVTVKRNSAGHPRLSWKAVDEISGYSGPVFYKVYRAASKNGPYTILGTTTALHFTNTSAKAGKTYYYKVRAVIDNTDANSAWSSVVSILAK